MSGTDGTSGGADPLVGRGEVFATTRWTQVVAAGRGASPDAERALAALCQAYWYPLYAYVRRRVRSREDAEDLTQAFFARFLERNPLGGLSADRGRFRAFLLAALQNFLSNERDRSGRMKRGGCVPHLSLDWSAADSRYGLEVPDPADPEREFDRAWAVSLLEQVVGRLRSECDGSGRAGLFEVARGYLMLGEEAIPHADAARRLGMEEGAFRVAVHRLRKRYRELLREELAWTLADPSQVDDELRALQQALLGG